MTPSRIQEIEKRLEEPSPALIQAYIKSNGCSYCRDCAPCGNTMERVFLDGRESWQEDIYYLLRLVKEAKELISSSCILKDFVAFPCDCKKCSWIKKVDNE